LNNNLTINQYLENIRTEYFTGGFTKCWDKWGFTNQIPQYNKIYYIVDGECYLKIDDKEYIAKKGQLILLPYNSVQTYYHISKNHLVKYWLHCTFSCNDKDLLELISLPHIITVDNHEYLSYLFKQILLYDGQPNITSKLLQKSYIIQLLAYYFEKSDSAEKSIFKDEKISILMSYIENNFQNDININTLCNVTHFHPNYFIRFFKKIIGISPIEYINNVRIEHAKKHLQALNIPIKNIAFNVGFKNSYYFSRIFKKKTGFTPSKYRLISNAKHTQEEIDDN